MSLRILIADDDDISRDLLEHMLEQEGYEVRTAATGLEAYSVLRAESIQLVITDWEMPELSGIELCRLIRQSGSDNGYVYVIMLSGHNERNQIVQGLAAGADDFLTKPLFRDELLVRIRAGERVLSLETRDVAIFALAKLAESRDNETGMHLERVQQYARVLTAQLLESPDMAGDIDPDLVRLIYLTSPLHDIGKVGIPDQILLKPGKLTAEEIQIMRRHVDIGTATLDACLARFPGARFFTVAREIAASHHEKWNGTGYPRGLSGNQIPIAGRIVALADVYDALRSKRHYKEAISHEAALEIIVRESGKHFDPKVVQAFLAIQRSFARIATEFADDVETQVIHFVTPPICEGDSSLADFNFSAQPVS
jgi:putative two-component system response regulator